MRESLKDYLDNLDFENVSDFVDGTDSKFNMVKEVKKVSVDLSWIDQVEETIPYLDNIIRKPRKFIVQDEDIVPVEKSKKITQDTVKHLSQHTSLIQGLDEDGTIRPVKVLNITKEETMDLYENRFIYSLIKNLYNFIRKQMDVEDYEASITTTKNFAYEGQTKIDGENVNTKVLITSKKKEILETASRKSTKERLTNINEIISGFMNSKFIKSISNATPVRSPIRRTNVILKDKNFKKALELWEFLEKYNYEDPVKEEDNITNETKNINKYNLDFANYVDYNNINENIVYESNSKEKIKNYINALVDELVFKDRLTDNEFKRVLTEEIAKARVKRKKIHNEIKRIFNSYITKEEGRLNKAATLLKK